jgi:3-deoxy-7-phosphoheptulonate synthase
MQNTRNLRIESVRPLLSPAILLEEIPLSTASADTVASARRQVADVLAGADDRLVVVVGPCSIHDPAAAEEYAGRLHALAARLSGDLCVIMRVYFEKPRSTVGWKGLINDPDLDGTFHINKGLRAARGLLARLTARGLPCATEFLDPISPQFVADAISWGAIGARTVESQVHRELASGLSMPIGFKNGTTGAVQVAIDAVTASAQPHRFLGVTEQGLAGIVTTVGNPHCHVILRGGGGRPNFDGASVVAAAEAMRKAGLRPSLMVDCSHGNSQKDFRRQPAVAHVVAEQVAAGAAELVGVMVESHLVEGRQDLEPGRPLTYGQSVTDACLGWDATGPLLDELAEAVRARRHVTGTTARHQTPR